MLLCGGRVTIPIGWRSQARRYWMLPPKIPRRIEGFSLASLELAWRSLRASGVPSSKWLQTASTRRTVAVYNTALDRFVSLQANELARGISEQDFGLHSV